MKYDRDKIVEQESTSHLALVREGRQQQVRVDSAMAGDEPDEPGFDPVAMLKRALRGRWGWIIFFSIVGMFAGAMLGWKFEKPQYKSEGVLRVAYSLPPVIQETDQNQGMAMFESFMRSQQLRMSSQSMAEKALALMYPGTPVTSDMLADFADRLDVEHPGNTEHLRVLYTDTDKLRTASAVSSLINAFRTEYDKTDQANQQQRIALLEAHRDELSTKLANIQKQIETLVVNDSTKQHVIDQKQQLLAEQLAVASQYLNDYTKKETDQRLKLQSLLDGGALEANPAVIELNNTIERTHRLVDHYQGEIMRLRGMGATDSFSTAPATGDVQEPIIMTASGNDSIALEAKKLELERVNEDAIDVRKDLAVVLERIEALKLESESRLEILSPGEIPLQPFRDRRKILAWMGGTFGLCLPTALIVLLGFARPRYRYSDETQQDVAGPAGLLGILPALPNQMNDPERAAGAAQCVHQMRVMLQVAANGKPRQYLVTSACAGEGKTSMSLALALSFAASGSRTLIVDADLVGRALTRGFGAGNERGLYEALGTGDSTPYVRQTTSGLWFLPAGRANALHASKVSGHAVKNFLDIARKEFDVVVIDSGPILGSVEAATFAPEVDGVIVAVSRGQQPALVEKTSSHLRAIGARIEGYVFNRAKAKDFYRSSYASSIRPMSSREMLVRVLSAESDGLLRFGPLVESVISSLPANEQDEDDTLQASHDAHAVIN